MKRPPTPDGHINSPPKEKPRKLPETRVLILGPSGTGKSSLINMIGNEGFQVASQGMGLCTTKFWNLQNSVMINERAFRLIDSPGFNTNDLGNADILKQLVAYLVKAVSWFSPGKTIGLESFMQEILGAQQGMLTKKSGRPVKITLEESETTRQQLQDTLEATEAELKSLRSQLEQTQLEYASLRSELQLNDNTEQSTIVQSLQDLNRTIDDFGRSVAEFMVDNFAATLNKDDPTTLDAPHFTELQRQFGHQGGRSSLAASLEGNGLPIEDFVDLALRNLLCQMLCKSVFIPFCPTLSAATEPGFMTSLYEEVRRQVSPTVAAKWRASTFMALSKGNKLDKPTIGAQVEGFITEDVQPLLNNLFGQSNAVALTEAQRDQVQDVITAAWELNHVLKGEVVTLGDFLPLCCERGALFDPKTMVEFEASKKRKPGSVAICTIRLGLTLSHTKGAGKDGSPSVLINSALGESVREISDGYELATKDFYYNGLRAGKHNFRLIDSPGFDNTSMSDGEIFKKLIQFLCGGKTPAMIAGVIYLLAHNTPLGSGVLKRNLCLLHNLLGDSFMDRLTILLVPRSREQIDQKELVRPLLDPKSPFYPLHRLGAQVDVLSLETQAIRKLLLSYTQKPPVLMNVQVELCGSGRVPNNNDISTYLSKRSWTREGASAATKAKTTTTRLFQLSTDTLSSTGRNFSDIKRLELELAENKKKAESLHMQLQQNINKYNSLCSQLQIHENTEQSEIVQGLVDLNRRIEDLALSWSQYLVDTYGGQDKTTTQYAFCLSELKRLFEHVEGRASLVQSSRGTGMLIEDFLDVAVRSILCEQLYKRVFAPFHPGIPLSDPKNSYTAKLYNRIKDKETQATLGRWRTASFAAISGVIGEQELLRLKTQVGLDILNENVMPMLKHLFGPNKNIRLQKVHGEDLTELVIQAWDWCVMAKETIVLLGDYQPIAYRYGTRFNDSLMSEFEALPESQLPNRILSTIGLGLDVSRAEKTGDGVCPMTVLKASVVTEGWFRES
ncbi:AIG1 domain protein, putative, partial [Rhizoctonia solani AG-3 Rhs1AP]